MPKSPKAPKFDQDFTAEIAKELEIGLSSLAVRGAAEMIVGEQVPQSLNMGLKGAIPSNTIEEKSRVTKLCAISINT